MTETYRADLVSPVTSQTPLAMDTPMVVIKALANIYPLMVIVDNVLSTLQWRTADSQLVCVHLLMFCLSLRFLLSPHTIALSSLTSASFILDYTGLMSTVFIGCSVSYYIYTVLEQTRFAEPPTVDDIVLLLQSIQNKLDTSRRNMLRVVKITTIRELVQWVTLATLFQLMVFKLHLFSAVHDSRDYVITCVAIAGLYHSQSFQGLLKLVWRVRVVRSVCVWWSGKQRALYSGRSVSAAQWFAEMEAQSRYITVKLIVDDVEELTKINVLRRKLVELYDEKSSDDNSATSALDSPTISFNIMEVKIHQHQRKWNGRDWEEELLSYERPQYTVTSTHNTHNQCESPNVFDKALPERWVSLDHTWYKSAWHYSSTDWNYIGKCDTPECFTRSRVWHKRIFQRSNDA
ncbi:Pex32 protein [Maudiozyma humilis]|uniref:Pex32 protein n=1 Tax=Maudiozyma humilis TaxID=51915 RepID=A0AAV5S865_MAUHU|nr:Pex32 protein [Kazachstania humilis]